jgi:hypothetical protein
MSLNKLSSLLRQIVHCGDESLVTLTSGLPDGEVVLVHAVRGPDDAVRRSVSGLHQVRYIVFSPLSETTVCVRRL